jgi:hypothetical protein
MLGEFGNTEFYECRTGRRRSEIRGSGLLDLSRSHNRSRNTEQGLEKNKVYGYSKSGIENFAM